MTEMTFEEKMKYLEDNYDGIGSMAFYKAQGGVKCKTMSWGAYLSCIEELIKMFKEKPELLSQTCSSAKGCGKIFHNDYGSFRCGGIEDLKHQDSIMLCPECSTASEERE